VEIKFTNLLKVPVLGFEPQPAKKIIPDWYKNLESYQNGKKIPTGEGQIAPTIKRCMPVFDALTAGYIIFSYTDLYVSIKDGQHWFEWPSIEAIKFHPVEQAPTHPNTNGNPYPKWISPWGIKTPKGYSCLFIPPTHRENVFSILEGVVDTDNYDNNVNLPFVMKDKNFEGYIPAGTPIAQVIPFKRDNWTMKFGTEEDQKKGIETLSIIRRTFFDGYKNNYRQEKDYN
jgi:hypothetical protein